MPPNYQKDECMEYVTSLIVEHKRNYKDPYITLVRDFNQRRVEQAMADFVDIREMQIGAVTRGSRTIDCIFVNNLRAILKSGTLNALKTDAEDQQEVHTSDHRIVYTHVTILRKESFNWESYSYIFYNYESTKNLNHRSQCMSGCKLWKQMGAMRRLSSARGQ